jgi:RND family efflux transporter MFP subunit
MKTLTITLLLLTVSALTACGSEPQTPEETPAKPAKTLLIADYSAAAVRYFPGKVLANQEADLAFEVSGQLIEFPVDEGSQMKKGELLARLDPQIYQNQVNESKARYELAYAQLKRGEELIKREFISRNELDILRSKFRIEEASLSNSERDLRNTVIYAPFDGLVAKKFVENFERVDAKEKILSFQDIADIDIEVFVPEQIILQVPEEKPDSQLNFVATFNTLPTQKFPVTFKEYSAEADPDVQAYRVVFTMQNPSKLNPFPGMSVTISGTVPSTDNGSLFLIPASSVFYDDNQQPAVWLVDPHTHTIIHQPVEVGRMDSDQIQILSGLKPGDRIVTAGVHFLQKNDKIRLVDPP